MNAIFWNESPTLRTTTRSIGSYKIAHWIRKHGYDCQVIDFISKMEEQYLYANTVKFISKETKILGISTTFLCNSSKTWPDGTVSRFPKHVVDVVKRIKFEFPHLKIVLGGYASDKLYMFGLPDATVMSYTNAVEDIFLELLEHYLTGSEPPNSEIAKDYIGISDSSNLPVRPIYSSAKKPKYKIETDDFIWQDRDLIIPQETLPLDISRGCIFTCRFCQYPHLGKKKLDYIRGMEFLKNEIVSNYNKFGTTRYILLDDTFNDTVDKLKAFNDMTATLPFKITYTTYLRADLIDRFPDMAYMLKESGLFGAVHGLESLHPYASNLMGKAWSGKKAKEFIPKLFHDIWKGEVAQELNFIIGLPKETKEDILSTVKWFEDNKLYSIFLNTLGVSKQGNKNNMWTISSEFERNAEKYGIMFDNNDVWYNETWTQKEAAVLTNSLKQRRDLLKNETWDIQNLLTIGYTREFILNTTLENFDLTDVRQYERNKFQTYMNLLTNL